MSGVMDRGTTGDGIVAPVKHFPTTEALVLIEEKLRFFSEILTGGSERDSTLAEALLFRAKATIRWVSMLIV